MNASGADARPPARPVVECAATWCATIHGGDASPADHDACQRWRAEHPDHDLAYRRLEALWTGFDNATAFASPAAARQVIAGSLAKDKRASRTKTAATVLSAALAAVAVWTGLRIAPPAWLLADHRTRAGEWRVVNLPDHSRIILNTDSAIDVRYDNGQRLIELRRGEILVEVAKEAGGRPFIVQTPDGTAQALGTRYVVRLESDHTDVTVTESTVRACASMPVPCADLAAGQRARLSPMGVTALSAVEPEAAEAWARKSLAVDNQRLTRVLAELARYRSGRISFDPAELAGLRVSGVFPLDDTDRALQALTASLPLAIKRYTPLLLVVELR